MGLESLALELDCLGLNSNSATGRLGDLEPCRIPGSRVSVKDSSAHDLLRMRIQEDI